MYHYLAIAAGGALGALSRFWLGAMVERFNQSHFPVGTFAVNLLGSLCIGILYILFVEKAMVNDNLRPFMVIGFLGAMTTFSTFSLDTVLLIQNGRPMTALAYTLSSVIICHLACWAGMAGARTLFN